MHFYVGSIRFWQRTRSNGGLSAYANCSMRLSILKLFIGTWLFCTQTQRRERMDMQADRLEKEKRQSQARREHASTQRNCRLIQFRLESVCKQRLASAFEVWTRLYFEWQWKEHTLCSSLERLSSVRRDGERVAMVFSEWRDLASSARKKTDIFVDGAKIAVLSTAWRKLCSHTREQTLMARVCMLMISRRKNRCCVLAFETWHCFIVELCNIKCAQDQTHRRALLIMRKITRRESKEAFSKWHSEQRESLYRRRGCERMQHTQRRNTCLKNMVLWSEYVVDQRRVRRRITKTMGSISSHVMASAFELWHNRVLQRIRRQTLCARSMKHLQRTKVARTLAHWVQCVSTHRLRRRTLSRILSHRKIRMLVAALSKLHTTSSRSSQQDWNISRLRQICVRSMQRKALQQWMALHLHEKNLKHLSSKSLVRFRGHRKFLTFIRWRYVMHLHSIVTRSMRRLHTTILAGMFITWTCNVVERKQLKAKTYKVVWRLLDRMLVSSFEAMRKHATMQRELRKKVTHMVFRLLNRVLVKSFDAWWTHGKQRQAHTIKHAQMNSRLTIRCLGSAIGTWQHAAKQMMHVRKATVRMITRLVERAITAAFDTWLHAAYTQKMTARMIARMLKRTMMVVFKMWQHKIHVLRELDMKHARIFHRTRHGCLIVHFEAWFDFVLKEQKRRLKMAKYLIRVVRRAKMSTFNAWQESLRWFARVSLIFWQKRLKMMREAMTAWQEALDLGIRRWRQKSVLKKRRHLRIQVTMFWEWSSRIWRWRHTASLKKRRDLRIQDIILWAWIRRMWRCRHMTSLRKRSNFRCQEMCFWEWNHLAQCRRLRMLQLERHFSSKWPVLQFRGWLSLVSKLRQARALAMEFYEYFQTSLLAIALHEWKKAHQVRRQIRTRVQHAQRNVSALNFNEEQDRWNAVSREEQRLRHIMLRCISRLLHNRVWAAWRQWMCVVHLVHRSREAAVVSLQRLIRMECVQVVECWRTYVLVARMIDRKHESAVQQRISEVLACWQKYSVHVHLSRRKLVSAVKRCAQLQCCNVIRSWKEIATIRTQLRLRQANYSSLISKTIIGRLIRFQIKVFCSWVLFVHSLRDRGKVQGFCDKRVARMSLSFLIAAWRMQATRLALISKREAVLHYRVAANTLNAAAHAWKVVTLANIGNRARSIVIEWKMLKFRLKMAWKRWIHFTDVRRHFEHKHLILAKGISSVFQIKDSSVRNAVRIFLLWRHNVERRNHWRVSHVHFVTRQIINDASRVFRRLKAYTTFNKQLETITTSFSVRLRIALICRLFFAWLDCAAGSRILDALQPQLVERCRRGLIRRMLRRWSVCTYVRLQEQLESFLVVSKRLKLLKSKTWSWHAVVVKGRRYRSTKQKMIQGRSHRICANWFHSWVQRALLSRRYRLAAAKVLRRRRYKICTAFFYSWMEQAHKSNRIHAKIRSNMQEERFYLVLTAVQGLKKHMVTSRILKSAYLIMLGIQFSMLKRILDSWRHVVILQRLLRLQMQTDAEGFSCRELVANRALSVLLSTRRHFSLNHFWSLWMVGIAAVRNQERRACKFAHSITLLLARDVLYCLKAHVLRVARAILLKLHQDEKRMHSTFLLWASCRESKRQIEMRADKSARKCELHYNLMVRMLLHAWHGVVQKQRILLAHLPRRDITVKRQFFEALRDIRQRRTLLELRGVQIFVSAAIRIIRLSFWGLVQYVALQRRCRGIWISRTVKFHRRMSHRVFGILKERVHYMRQLRKWFLATKFKLLRSVLQQTLEAWCDVTLASKQSAEEKQKTIVESLSQRVTGISYKTGCYIDLVFLLSLSGVKRCRRGRICAGAQACVWKGGSDGNFLQILAHGTQSLWSFNFVCSITNEYTKFCSLCYKPEYAHCSWVGTFLFVENCDWSR